MADIKRAAKWMERGKTVQQNGVRLIPSILEFINIQYGSSPAVQTPLKIGDLLQENWEIVDE